MSNVGEWGKLELLSPDFSAIDTFVDFIDQLKDLLTVLSDFTDALLTFLGGLSDPLTELLKRLIAKLKEIVESLIEEMGVYALMVPNGKRFQTTFMGLGDVTPPVGTHLFPEGPDLNDPNLDPGKREFLINMNRYNGGNPAFYRMVLDSIYDRGDRNRPKFTSEDDWVGGVVLMLGSAADPFGFLDDLWTLKGMFGSLFDSTYITTIPTAKNLTAEALTRPGKDGKFSVLLKWDTMDTPFARIADLGNTVLVPERQAIIMIKNKIEVADATNIVQLMGTRDLKEGDTSLDKTATVIYEGRFNITKISHVHKIEKDADPDDLYCFAVVYKNKVWRSDENWTVDPGYALGYWDTSNIARVVPFPVISGSTPPDWVRTPSFGDLFPDLAYFLRMLTAQIDNIASRLMSVSDLWKDYVAFLREEVDRYETLINTILDQIQKLAESLKLPTATGGVYARVFEGKGGNQFFLSDLATSLSRSYPDAPPFHRGDEYVMGVVLMAGGEKNLVKGFVSILKLIFGLGSFGEDNLMDSVGDAITALESQCFGGDFNPVPCSDALTETLEEKVIVCEPEELPTVKFGDNLQPLS